MYLWIVIVGAINSFIDACGIGSNDLANSFGTTYGSRILNLKQIVVLASVCELSGALLLGSSVTSTLAGSVSYIHSFKNYPYVLMYGMLCALAGSTIWIYIATYLELPVSTTHSIVGGILGFSFVFKGDKGVNWYSSVDEFPYINGVVPIVISWFTSPILTGLCSVLLYGFMRRFIFRSIHGVNRSIYTMPFVVLCTFFIEAFFIITKAAKSRLSWSVEQSVWVSVCIGVGASIISLGLIPFLKRRISNYTKEETTEEGMSMDTIELFNPKVEFVFKYLQIFTSICASFAHGANDVSNSVGPFAAIWHIYQTDNVSSKINVPIWILVIGGSGIVVGLATYGIKIIKVLGEKITIITPSRGFVAELSTALVISFASRYGMPISSTQCITGAIIGISLMDYDLKNLKWKMISKIYLAWIFTLIITSLISAAIFAQGIYSPYV